jgi:hypothetical protein
MNTRHLMNQTKAAQAPNMLRETTRTTENHRLALAQCIAKPAFMRFSTAC